MLTFRVYLLKESESARKFKRTLSRRHQNLLCGKTISNGKFCSGKYRRSCVFCLARKPLHQMKNEWSQLMIVVILQTIILQIVQEDYIFFRAKTIKTLYNEYIGRQCVYLREECIQWCLPWTNYQCYQTLMIFAPVLAPALCPYFMSVSRRTRTHTRTQNLYVKTKF